MSSEALHTILDLIRGGQQEALVRTDSSVLLIYPPSRELDAEDFLRDRLFPTLLNDGLAHRELDLRWKFFDYFESDEIAGLSEDEFHDRKLVRQEIASRVEVRLMKEIENLGCESSPLFLTSTASLHPFVRFGELLRHLRHLKSCLFVMFPGDERGGKLHFMNEPDGGNYLATKVHLF